MNSLNSDNSVLVNCSTNTSIIQSENHNSQKNAEITQLLKNKLDIEKLVVERSENKSLMNYEEPRRIGNTWAFWYINGEPRIVIGPHWPFFACLLSFISIISVSYFYFLWDSLNFYVKYIGLSLYFIQISSYLLTVLKNPGLPKKEMYLKYSIKQTNYENFRICSVCNVVMNLDDNTSHCDDCNVCIEGHDHHCPWTTKCVGKGNLKPFYFFVSFTFVLMGFLFFGLATSNIN